MNKDMQIIQINGCVLMVMNIGN